MLNLIWAQSRNWTSRVLDRQSTPPRHFYGSPVTIPFLVAICIVVLLIWFWMDPLSFWEFFGVWAFALSRLSADRLAGVLSVDQTRAAVDALVISIGDQIIKQRLPLKLVRPVASDSSFADGEGDQQLLIVTVLIDQYPSVAKLDARNARMVDAKAMLQLRRLSEAACAEKWRNIIQVDVTRFSNVIEDLWRLCFHEYPNTFADCSELTAESTKNWIYKWKITARLLCLVRCQLNEQDLICQNLKEDYFAKVAGPHIQGLLEDASAFSSANWTTGDVSNMVPIFEAFLDSLCNIKQSLSRSHPLHVNFADIFRMVVTAFEGIIGGPENDLDRNEENAIISATYCLIVALEFFYRNINVQPILASAESNYTKNLCDCWISKVKKDAERLFQNEKDRQYIFILNNIYFVWDRKCGGEGFLSAESLKEWFKTQIDNYIDMYVQYWVPLQQLIEGDYLLNPCRSYLVTFIEEFQKKCDHYMNWKVLQPELRKIVREKIKSLLVGPYDKFLVALLEAGAAGSSSESSDKKRKGLKIFKIMRISRGITRNSSNDNSTVAYTVQYLTDVINNLHEG